MFFKRDRLSVLVYGAALIVAVGALFINPAFAQPAPPILTSPGTASSPGTIITTTTPTFQWQPSTGATDYGLYISRHLGGGIYSLVFDSETDYGTITGTSFTISSGFLASGQEYRWNMMAHNAGGWSNLSSRLYFQVNTVSAPPPPILTSPGTASSPGSIITTTTPTFQWQPSTGATDYGLYISRHLGGGIYSLVFDSETDYGTITGTSFTISSGFLASGQEYRWNMMAHNVGGWSNLSSRLYFQVNTAPAPSITGVFPDPVIGSNSQQPFDISGSDFVSNPNVTLRDLSTGEEFPNRPIGFFSSTQITINPNFTTVPATWSVEVINPDGQSTGQHQFEVVAPDPPPSITSVFPDPVVGSDSQQPFDIFGNDFVSSPNVTLRDLSTGEAFPNRPISFFSSTQITINPNFTTVPATWSVEVINPDGQSTGQHQFEVVAPDPPPSITSVFPDPVVGSDNQQPFDIFGNDFVSSPNVTLRDLSTGEAFPNRPISFFSSTQITIEPLFTTTAATWSVEVINPGGQSSDQYQFEVVAPGTLLAPPTLVEPADSATGVSTTPFFDWTTVNGANRYWLTVATSSGALPTDPDATTCPGCIISCTTTASSHIAGGSCVIGTSQALIQNTTYFWRAQGWNTDGTQGEYSTIFDFHTENGPPPPPAPVAPGSAGPPGPSLITTTPTFSWQASGGATNYGVYISRHIGGGVYSLVFDSEVHFGPISTTTVTIPPGFLASGEEYRWNMRAQNAVGWSEYSGRLYFQIASGSPPGTPSLLGPGTASAPGEIVPDTTPTFSWQALAEAADYGLYISHREGIGNYVLVFDSEVQHGPITGTSFILPPGFLAAGEEYRWNLRGNNANGWGPFSVHRYFQTAALAPPSAPTLTDPGVADPPGLSVPTARPTFSWNPAAGATDYGLYISEHQGGGVYSEVFNSEVDHGTIAGESFTLLPGFLTEGNQYRWHMAAHNSAGWGEPSEFSYFSAGAGSALAYVALGDSYSSGEGVSPYDRGTDGFLLFGNNCHRSRYSWTREEPGGQSAPPLFPGSDRGHYACSGAVVDYLLNPNDENDEREQKHWVEHADVVTLSIGGNDVGFGPILISCSLGFACDVFLNPWVQSNLADLAETLPYTLCKLREEAPDDASILVVGYPRLFGLSPVCPGLSVAEREWIRSVAEQLNNTIALAASQVEQEFVPGVASLFESHLLCDAIDDEWLGVSVHPNKRGQQAYSLAVRAYVTSNPLSPTPRVPCVEPAGGSRGAERTPPFSPGDLGVQAWVDACGDLSTAFVAGEQVLVNGLGFAPSSGIDLELAASEGSYVQELGTLLADDDGVLDAVVEIPGDVPFGPAGITAEGPTVGGGVRWLVAGFSIEPSATADTDVDGVPDLCDNCTTDANGSQNDSDDDGIGDPCDSCPLDPEDDWDNDGVCADLGHCSLRKNNAHNCFA